MSTDRIVGGKEVSTGKKYPYQIWVQVTSRLSSHSLVSIMIMYRA